MNDDHAEMFAQNASGDIRQLVLSIEMFYCVKQSGIKVESSDVRSYIDQQGIDSDAKICAAAALVGHQSDDEKILGIGKL